MAQTNSLRNHIYLPVPNPKDLPKEPPSKPEYLSTILHNLDTNHQIIRTNILTTANAHLETQPTTPSNPTNSNNNEANRATATTLLLQNLHAPAPPQDPRLPTPNSLPPPPDSLLQEPPPPEIRLAHETFLQLDQYDQHARSARQYYQSALERIDPAATRRRSSGGGGGGGVPGSNVPRPPAAAVMALNSHQQARQQQGYGAGNGSSADGTVRRSSGSANASPGDPRIRSRQ